MIDLIQIVIADDHALLRQVMAHFLNSQNGMQVIGEAPDGVVAVEMAVHFQPDIVLMDCDMPRMNGVEATRKILADHSQIVVIGLSMHEQGPVETAMLDAGAAAFLTKGGDREALLSTIRELGPSKVR